MDILEVSDGMFPAGAGMNRLSFPNLFRKGNVPRGSGDEPFDGDTLGWEEECSPRERG